MILKKLFLLAIFIFLSPYSLSAYDSERMRVINQEFGKIALERDCVVDKVMYKVYAHAFERGCVIDKEIVKFSGRMRAKNTQLRMLALERSYVIDKVMAKAVTGPGVRTKPADRQPASRFFFMQKSPALA